jgi:bacterioferritin-associated ferredoxin
MADCEFCVKGCVHGCADVVVCYCLGVTEAEVLTAIHDKRVTNLRDLKRCTGAGEGCTVCHDRLRTYLESHGLHAERPHGRSRHSLTTI